MASDGSVCPNCGAPLDPRLAACPACHFPIRPLNPRSEPVTAPPLEAGTTPKALPLPPDPATPPTGAHSRPSPRRGPPSPPANPFAAELGRRLSRLAQWGEGAQPLGVELPHLPAWAIEAARTAPDPEPWAEVVRGIERISQKRLVQAFEEWERRTRARLTRLEAYSVDSRLEREQIEDTLHAARTGDIPQALSTFQQVDRVVALKERHLDQAREELERVIALLKDMQALGVEPPQDPGEVADDLESELRAGKLASLKQQIRALRLQAVNRLKAGLPKYITEYGDYLLGERSHGIATELEATELARGAREFFRGHPEEALRRLRALQQRHGLPPSRPARSPPPDLGR
jgi:hypothetical protein